MAKTDFEEFDDLEDPFQDAQSEAVVEQAMPEASGSTSREIERSTGRADSAARRVTASSRLEFLKSMTVYDAMLVASALSIMLAILLMFIELTSFGGIFFQWRTTEAGFDSITPP